jgi:hypothetical protein
LGDRRIAIVVDEIVAEEDRARLAAGRLARREHGVAEPERLLLPHRVDVHHAGDRRHLVGELGVAALAQRVLELVGVIEVILDRVLVAAVHDDDVGDAGAHGLVDHELDRRHVDDR